MDGGAPPTDVWLHDALEARTSTISGFGLFASEQIASGIVVIRFGGRVMSTADLHALFDDDRQGTYVDTISIDDDLHLVLPERTPAHFANHSCDPSLWHVSQYEVATRRAIDAGDELTIDYATNSGDPSFTMECTCASPLCRGTITAEDWRRPELQDRYEGHWIPVLATLIERNV
jgi:hypothetical protein